MAKIDMMWLNDGMHGRADKTSRTYAKVDRLTGKTYAVTLRNPRTGKDFDNAQIQNNNRFGALCKGVHVWVKLAKSAEASAEDKAQYEKFVKQLKAQHTYPSVFALIMAKRFASVNEALNAVTITDGDYTKTVEFVFNARPLVDAPEDPDWDNSGNSGSSQGDSSNGAEQGEGNVTISLSAVGNGKVSIDGGTAGISKSKSVAPGTSVAILATPDSGATFTRWSDGNTEASRNVVVSAAMNLTATFSGGNAGGGDNGGGASEG